MDFVDLSLQCAPTVHVKAMHALVRTESNFNQFAIGVVEVPLKRQPRSLPEALAAVEVLERKGYNYSVGYAQVNKHNFKRYGLTPRTAFDACPNMTAGSKILERCFNSAAGKFPTDQHKLRAAYSCYYSGNFLRGFKPDQPGRSSYVERVIGHALGTTDAIPTRAPLKGVGAAWGSSQATRTGSASTF